MNTTQSTSPRTKPPRKTSAPTPPQKNTPLDLKYSPLFAHIVSMCFKPNPRSSIQSTSHLSQSAYIFLSTVQHNKQLSNRSHFSHPPTPLDLSSQSKEAQEIFNGLYHCLLNSNLTHFKLNSTKTTPAPTEEDSLRILASIYIYCLIKLEASSPIQKISDLAGNNPKAFFAHIPHSSNEKPPCHCFFP